MIGYIQGKVLSADGKKAIILTSSGVGYEVRYSYYVEAGTEIGLYIHHQITDNDQSLWGLNTVEDKNMLALLITVNKVGPSKAYPLITTIGMNDLISAIQFEQVNVLTKAQGIGKKVAEQIILSLKDKIGTAPGLLSSEASPGETGEVEQIHPPEVEQNLVNRLLLQEAMLALETLGYKDKDIMSLLQKNLDETVKTSEDLLKKVLREL